MFFDRISAETCLKKDYFGSKSPPNCQALGAPPPNPFASGGPQNPVQVKWLENVQDPTPIVITNWCRCLAILGQNETYIFLFSALPPLFKKRSRATMDWDTHHNAHREVLQ